VLRGLPLQSLSARPGADRVGRVFLHDPAEGALRPVHVHANLRSRCDRKSSMKTIPSVQAAPCPPPAPRQHSLWHCRPARLPVPAVCVPANAFPLKSNQKNALTRPPMLHRHHCSSARVSSPLCPAISMHATAREDARMRHTARHRFRGRSRHNPRPTLPRHMRVTADLPWSGVAVSGSQDENALIHLFGHGGPCHCSARGVQAKCGWGGVA